MTSLWDITPGSNLFVDDYELFFDPAGGRVCLIGAQDEHVLNRMAD